MQIDLDTHAHIPTQEIYDDIRDTQVEINYWNKRLSEAQAQIFKREEFIKKLQNIIALRRMQGK